MARAKAHNRETIDTGPRKRYVRRDDAGSFQEIDEQHRSLSQDHRRQAKSDTRTG